MNRNLKLDIFGTFMNRPVSEGEVVAVKWLFFNRNEMFDKNYNGCYRLSMKDCTYTVRCTVEFKFNK